MDYPTVPMRPRPRRMSSEFMAVGVPLTPARERAHDMITARQLSPLHAAPRPASPSDDDVLDTGRIELDLAGRLARGYERSWWLVIGGSTVVGLAAGFACMAALT